MVLRYNISFTKVEHYNKILRSLYFIGFYDQSFTVKRKILNFILFSTIFLNVYIGCWNRLYSSKSIGSIFLVSRGTIFCCELLSCLLQQSEIAKMIEVFRELGDPCEVFFNKLCSELIKAYRVAVIVVVIAFLILNIISTGQVSFFLPTLYENIAHGFGFPLVYFIHILHCIIYILVVISIDLLLVISVIKLQGLVGLLCQKMKGVTDGDQFENEKKLDDCMFLHVKVIE